MMQYLLSVHGVEGDAPPPPEVMQKAFKDVDAFNPELQAAGAWVFSGGLHPPSTATVVRVQRGAVLLTDGPFTEGKEHIGGVNIITAPDLDAALAWGRRLAEAT